MRGLDPVTSRELFRNIVHYGHFDRMPVVHPGAWFETTDRWHAEGMPKNRDEHAFFHAQPPMGAPIPVYVDVYPGYEEKVVEETDRYLYFQHGDGVVAQYVKGVSGLPHRVDFLMKDRSGWPNYKARLQPHPDRIPDDLDEAIADAQAKDLPISIETGSMVGWLRNWLGTETFCTTCREDPVLIYEWPTPCPTSTKPAGCGSERGYRATPRVPLPLIPRMTTMSNGWRKRARSPWDGEFQVKSFRKGGRGSVRAGLRRCK